jgi:hypothetical protein
VSPSKRAVFRASAVALSVALGGALAGTAYVFGVKHYHYSAVRPIFHATTS